MFFKGKGKLSRQIGSVSSENDPKFIAWDEEGSVIISWLWNLMQPKISRTYMFLTTVNRYLGDCEANIL